MNIDPDSEVGRDIQRALAEGRATEGPRAVLPPAGPPKGAKRQNGVYAPSLSEKAFSKQVVDYANLRGWRCAHFRPALTADGKWVTPVAAQGVGFPDLVCVRGGKVLWVELKAGKGRLRPEQKVWLDSLRAAGQEVYVWHPKDWEQLAEVLS